MFRDRVDAGAQLARKLTHLINESPVVLGLARGGMVVADQVATTLGAPLDVLIVRKLGAPGQEEFAVGAIGDGVRVVNARAVRSLRLTPEEVAAIEARERRELDRRDIRYRDGHPLIDVRGRTAIVVDDGIATGSSAIAACEVVHAQGAAKITLAVPVAPTGWRPSAEAEVDEFVTVLTSSHFVAIGLFYADFTQVSDSEVTEILARSG